MGNAQSSKNSETERHEAIERELETIHKVIKKQMEIVQVMIEVLHSLPNDQSLKAFGSLTLTASEQLQEFTCFPDLPTEVRLRIWKAFLNNESRLLIIESTGGYRKETFATKT
jgi:hypothetical protein